MRRLWLAAFFLVSGSAPVVADDFRTAERLVREIFECQFEDARVAVSDFRQEDTAEGKLFTLYGRIAAERSGFPWNHNFVAEVKKVSEDRLLAVRVLSYPVTDNDLNPSSFLSRTRFSLEGEAPSPRCLP